MSSKRTDWKTPKEFYRGLDRMFNFDFDPCPTDPEFDGLSIEWKERNFVNPPYGSEIGKRVKKAFDESQRRKTVEVMLVPSRTDTRWWHDYIMKAKEIWFVKARLRFDDQDGSAPFPSAVVVFEKTNGTVSPKTKAIDVHAKFL